MLVALAFFVLISPAVYSYTTTMLQPSSLPVWVRSVEWLRAHHGNWLVDEVEHYYYTWTAPSPGGPQLTSLPQVGIGPLQPQKVRPRHQPATWPPPIKPVFAHRCPARACGRARGRWWPAGLQCC